MHACTYASCRKLYSTTGRRGISTVFPTQQAKGSEMTMLTIKACEHLSSTARAEKNGLKAKQTNSAKQAIRKIEWFDGVCPAAARPIENQTFSRQTSRYPLPPRGLQADPCFDCIDLPFPPAVAGEIVHVDPRRHRLDCLLA